MMTEIIWCTLLFGGIALVLFVLKGTLKYKKLPPGPRGWPLVGNTLQQDPDRPYLTWSKWGEMYRDVFTVNNFGRPTVFCNSFEAIYEMFVTKTADFAGRPKYYAFDTITDGSRDVAGGDFSPEWTRRKKIFLNNLKMYGEGLKHLEDLMVDIISELEDDIKKSNQQPLDLQEPFILALANTLALLLLGHKYDRGNNDFQILLNLLDENIKVLSLSLQSILIESIPWLRYLPLPLCNLVARHRQSVNRKWAPALLEQKMRTYDENNLSCILDAYVKQHEEDMKNRTQHPIEYRHLVLFIQDFFMAGVNTSRVTLLSLFAILTAEQDIQTKVHEEIDRVIGTRHPELKDSLNMHYLHAVFEEVMRYCILVPTSLPHKACVDSEICGHFIPQGIELIANMWQVCHDTKIWGDPWKFRPERFLDEDGQMLPTDHPLRRCVMTFGAGRRKCPGENLARNRIFLITTSLLQKFHFKPVNDEQPPVHNPYTYKFGVVIMPQPYQVIAVPRE